MNSVQSFQQLWRSALERSGDSPFLHIEGGGESGRMLSYTFSAFIKRAGRISNALKEELGLKPGERVLILTDDPNDVALLLHGCWLCGLAVIPISSRIPDETVRDIVGAEQVAAVVYPPSAAARMASLAIDPAVVTHWLVTGGSTQFGSFPGVRRLEELLIGSSTAVDLDESIVSPDDLALIVPGGAGTALNHVMRVDFQVEQLLEAAVRFTALYPIAGADERSKELCWTSAPHMEFEGLVNSLLVPLFTGIPSLVRPMDDFRYFWDQMRSDGITIASITQDELRLVHRKGKSSTWVKPEPFTLNVSSPSRFSYELFGGFEERFVTELNPFYSRVEAGGLISCFPAQRGRGTAAWRQEYIAPACGFVLEGVEVRVVDYAGVDVESEIVGEVLVRSPGVAKLCGLDDSSTVTIDTEGFLHTSDEGFFLESDSGTPFLIITGSRDDLVERDGELINLARVTNVGYAINGVGYAAAVGFPNTHTGFEIGIYIIPLSAAHLAEAEIMGGLRRKLDWAECPKVVILGEKKELADPPGEGEILSRFEDHFYGDFRSSA